MLSYLSKKPKQNQKMRLQNQLHPYIDTYIKH